MAGTDSLERHHNGVVFHFYKSPLQLQKSLVGGNCVHKFYVFKNLGVRHKCLTKFKLI